MSDLRVTSRERRERRPSAGRAVLASALAAALSLAGAARADVEVAGLDDAQRANVLAYLDLDEEPCDAPGWRVEQEYQNAPAKIRSALEALGHYEPRVGAAIERTEACWHAKFTVEPGPPVLVRRFEARITGEAANDPAFAAVRDAAGLAVGAVLHHGDYEALKRRWSDLARERGYADAMFTESRIDVYPEQRVADIVLEYDSGKRYRFGAISFEQDVLSDDLLRSYLKIRAGDPYDARELTSLYVALADSGYFRNIDVRPLAPDRERGEIPIAVELTGAARRQISYGVGYSTDTGPRFRFARLNRRFNDRGHQFGVSAQISPVISEFTANYRMPIGDPRTEWASFDAGIKTEDTETSKSDSYEFGARRVERRERDWTRTEILSLLIEDFTVADEPGHSQLLMPGMNWTQSRADNSIRPSRGRKLSLDVRVAADSLWSDTDLVQAVAQGKWIWSAGRASRFLLRAQLGATAVDTFEDLPPSVRFFAGGDNSVRGYEFEALGPTNASGKVVGGRSLAVASFEYERRVVGRWSVATFVDSGNAFDGGNLDAKTGAGFGARWQSPLGPIRVDLAYPFDEPKDGWRLHISLGPDL